LLPHCCDKRRSHFAKIVPGKCKYRAGLKKSRAVYITEVVDLSSLRGRERYEQKCGHGRE